jgi:phosphatidate cytidylyltransferase
MARESTAILSVLLGRFSSEGTLLLGLGLIVMLVFAEQMIRRQTTDALKRLGATFLTIAYLGLGGALVLAIRMQYNVPVLVLFLVAVKFTDIGAYFTGSAIGRHKLIPWLSPGKSWEGLAGGLIVGAGASTLAAWALEVSLSRWPLPLWTAAVFGAAVGLAGQFADLCESLLKRSTGVKDSGAVLPEYGGILDILDSPLLSAPVAYLLLMCLA